MKPKTIQILFLIMAGINMCTAIWLRINTNLKDLVLIMFVGNMIAALMITYIEVEK